ncbi:FAD-dependent monooxygenase [Paractinoplanes ferrugineus]|uniref:FAD-binding domain-containing protein n=1 Tax=Paractinoplanes ferrugineus TaxID=113564 RepID=A0A919MDW9_9ACTN|nr:FAD-dependent oxidoreductase [Actinoplanes ferrugineus]GIE16246.1 hypothetical protein Afe05nite_80860 [Actinoplanes ferrugineus]
MPEIARAIVVGAGIGGLTTAIALQQRGVQVTVYERRREPSALLTGGGFMLWHNAVLALRLIGLDRAVVKAGLEIGIHEFRSDRDRSLATWSVSDAADRYGAPAIVLRRSELNSLLMTEAGPDVRLGVRCIGLTQDAGGATVRFDDGSTDTADIVIGADGLRSTVRSELRHGHDLPPRYAGYTAWQAIAPLPGEDVVPSGTFFNLWGRGGLRFLYSRLNPDEVYWDAIVSDDVGGAMDTIHQGKVEALLDTYQRWPAVVRQIVAATPEAAVLPIEIFDRPPDRLGPWGSGRVVLIGDAAHPMTLNLSQGAGQSIEDAVILAEMLTGSSGSSVPETVTAFEKRRLARVTDMINTSWQIGSMGRWQSDLRVAGRNAFMRTFFGSVGRKQSYELMMGIDF